MWLYLGNVIQIIRLDDLLVLAAVEPSALVDQVEERLAAHNGIDEVPVPSGHVLDGRQQLLYGISLYLPISHVFLSSVFHRCRNNVALSIIWAFYIESREYNLIPHFNCCH